MYTASFIFAPGTYDEDVHRLDDETARVARGLPGHQIVISQVLRSDGGGRLPGGGPVPARA